MSLTDARPVRRATDYEVCVDVRVADVGTLWLVTPVSSCGRDWLDENVAEDSTWWGSALVVERRYIVELVDGMLDSGLVIGGEGE